MPSAWRKSLCKRARILTHTHTNLTLDLLNRHIHVNRHALKKEEEYGMKSQHTAEWEKGNAAAQNDEERKGKNNNNIAYALA